MRVSITVFNLRTDKEQEFGIEVDEDDDVITFYLGDERLFQATVEKFADLMTAYGLIWGGWMKVKQEEKQKEVKE